MQLVHIYLAVLSTSIL